MERILKIGEYLIELLCKLFGVCLLLTGGLVVLCVVWQLAYCVVQFLEKDVTLSESVSLPPIFCTNVLKV